MDGWVGGEYRVAKVYDDANRVRLETDHDSWLFTFECLELRY